MCKNSKQLYLLELEKTEEVQDINEEQELILHEDRFSQLESSQPIEHMEISIHV